MPKVLSSTAPGFWDELKKAVTLDFSDDDKVMQQAAGIIADVRKRGDAALDEYTKKFDNADHKDGQLVVSKAEIDKACEEAPPAAKKAIDEAIKRVGEYHKKQLPADMDYKDGEGIRLGWKWTPMAIAGLYVPGGTASYPSAVLMSAIPARIAGVKKMVMCVPASKGKINPLVLYTAKVCGIDEIYRIGGAQAIAAMAYGTKTVKQVDKIVGPGNAYVAAAKKLVFGQVGIDMIAGPSEIAVVADDKNKANWIAADLLSQAEHDRDARVFLISDNESFMNSVLEQILEILPTLERKEIAAHAFDKNAIIIKVKNLDEAAQVVDVIAPEHVELAVENPNELMAKINNAGAIFIGRFAPEAIGDYMAGPSHVLPTGGTARFSSGLSVFDFLKRSSVIGCEQDGFLKINESTETLAKEEGLTAHALSVSVRKS